MWKLEAVEHIRVAPPVQVLALDVREPRDLAPLAISAPKRRAIAVELAHAVRGEPIHSARRLGRHQRQEIVELVDLQPHRECRRRAGGERLDVAEQARRPRAPVPA